MNALLRRKGTNVQSRERADARRQEDDVSLWRDYHTFLRSKLTLLEVRIAESRVAFERTDSLELEAENAQAALDRIPAGIRTMFEAVLEDRRGRVQGEMEAEARTNRSGQRGRNLDPDIIDRRALTELLAEAEGEVEAENTPKGYGWFPRGTAGDVRWYALDVAELLAAPTAASYTVAPEKDTARQGILRSVIAGIGLVIFLIIWFLVPRGQAARDAGTRAPLVSGSTMSGGATSATPIPMDVWPIQSAMLTMEDGQKTSISIAATTNASWPAMSETQRAYWQRNAFAPLLLCLAPDLVEKLVAIQIAGGGGWPDRVYTLSANRSSTTNLIIEPCRSNSAGTRRYGTLQQTPPLPAHAVGKPVTLPGKEEETIIVRAIEISGPGQDPALPEGQARITIAVDARPDLDWPSFAPTLILPSGQAYLPAETIANANGAELRYLVPLPTTDTVIAWDMTPPGGERIARWRASLAPPMSRIEVLRNAITVLDVVSQEQNGMLAISITITNQSQASLQLSRADIVMMQSDRLINTPDIGSLATPLVPGERRTLTFSAPSGGQQGLTLTIGTQSYRITM